MSNQHWIISVQDSINDYREVQTDYFDGTQAQATAAFKRPSSVCFKYFGSMRYQITMTANPIILQWPDE